MQLLYPKTTYLNVSVPGFGTRILDPVLQIDETYTGYGNISGFIYNALTNIGVAGVTLQLRSGINNTSGTPLATVTTNTNGAYSFDNVYVGNYTVLASKADYISTAFNGICPGGQNTSNQNGVISPLPGCRPATKYCYPQRIGNVICSLMNREEI